MKVVIHLHDELDYLIHMTVVEHPLTYIVIWGNRAFVKVGRRRYRQKSMKIINDTDSQAFKIVSPDD